MSLNKWILYSRMEEIRRFNQKMEETPEEWEKDIYRKAKEIPVSYEKLDRVLKESREKILLEQRKRQKMHRIRLSVTVITILTILILVFFLLIIAVSENSAG